MDNYSLFLLMMMVTMMMMVIYDVGDYAEEDDNDHDLKIMLMT